MEFVEDGRIDFEVVVEGEARPPQPARPAPEARPSPAPLLLALLAVGGILLLPVAIRER